MVMPLWKTTVLLQKSTHLLIFLLLDILLIFPGYFQDFLVFFTDNIAIVTEIYWANSITNLTENTFIHLYAHYWCTLYSCYFTMYEMNTALAISYIMRSTECETALERDSHGWTKCVHGKRQLSSYSTRSGHVFTNTRRHSNLHCMCKSTMVIKTCHCCSTVYVQLSSHSVQIWQTQVNTSYWYHAWLEHVHVPELITWYLKHMHINSVQKSRNNLSADLTYIWLWTLIIKLIWTHFAINGDWRLVLFSLPDSKERQIFDIFLLGHHPGFTRTVGKTKHHLTDSSLKKLAL